MHASVRASWRAERNAMLPSNTDSPRPGSHVRKQLARLAATLGLLLCSPLFSASSARADEIWMCGHQIITNYFFGWVTIRSVSGITYENQRTDIYVYGNTDYGWDRMPAIAAMGSIVHNTVHWGWMNSRIAIAGFDECRDPAKPCCNVLLH
jgi:hypothetical protein